MGHYRRGISSGYALSSSSCLKHYFDEGKFNKSIYVATASDNEGKLTYIFNELSQDE